MRIRLFVVGIGLTVLGIYLLLAPIAPGPSTTADLRAGESVDVYVPPVASIAGNEVDVTFSWGTAASCPGSGFGVNCYTILAPSASLSVFDCGVSSCDSGTNHTWLGSTDDRTFGSSGFLATPGHHYALRAHVSPLPLINGTNASRNASIPVRYSVTGPVLGGGLGVVVIVVGIVVGIRAVLRPRSRARKDTTKPSADAAESGRRPPSEQ